MTKETIANCLTLQKYIKKLGSIHEEKTLEQLMAMDENQLKEWENTLETYYEYRVYNEEEA